MRVLAQITFDPNFEIECVGQIDVIREAVGKAEKAKDAVVRFDVNIYGPKSARHSVSKKLSSERMFLQTPDCTRPGISYVNPQILELPGIELSAPTDQGEAIWKSDDYQDNKCESIRNPENFHKAVIDIYSSLTRAQNLVQVEGGKQVRTTLLP